MKIVALSDLHGHLPEVEPADVVIIGGDICPVIGSHKPLKQNKWLKETFTPWLEGIKAEHILGIAGNHDFVFEAKSWKDEDFWVADKLPWTYLQDSGVEIDGVKFYGYPWVPRLASWAFYATDDNLSGRALQIPKDTDILITHGPPYGILDKCSPLYGGDHVGDHALREEVLKRVKPDIHIFGHIHEAHGTENVLVDDDLEYIEFANVAIMNQVYRPTNKPTVFEYLASR